MEIINIGTNDSDQRIDSFLKKLMPAAPQSLIYKYLRTNKIKLNGSKPKPDTRISEGDIIKFFGDSSLISKKSFAPSATPRLNIIFLQYRYHSIENGQKIYTQTAQLS